MLRSMLSSAARSPTRITLPGWLMLRLWLVLALTLPAVGLGGWARPASVGEPQVAEQGVHAGPSGQANPAEIPLGFPLRGETEDAEDAEDSTERSEDAKNEKTQLRTRSASATLRPDLLLELERIGSSAGHRLGDPRCTGPGAWYREQLHNRGPPTA